MSVRGFLINLKKKIEMNSIKTPIKFVTGNQSADMDSVISAISYSYFSYLRDSNSILIPLINISKNDLRLRRDIKLLLESHWITEDLLYFIEDFKKLSDTSSKIELVLVDHCNVQGDLLNKYLNEGKLDVVGIIDHHDDERVFLDCNPRIIHSNGSCSALVFNYWYEQFNDKSRIIQNNEILELLLGPLLIDTSNMTQKVEEGDVKAFKIYKEILNRTGNSDFENFIQVKDDSKSNKKLYKSFYKLLKDAKKDLEGFKFYDVLRKDYKQFKFGDQNINVGFSSIGKSFEWLLTKYTIGEINETFANLMKDFSLDLLIITSSYTINDTNQYTREIGYYYDTRNSNKDIFRKLDDLIKDELQLNLEIYGKEKVINILEEINNNHNQSFRIFNQANIRASRKQVVPIVKHVLETN